MNKSIIKGRLVVAKLLIPAVLAMTFSARALTFNVTYDSSVTSQTNAAQIQTAFGIATQTMRTLYTNSSTVNITVFWGGASLGASSTSLEAYKTYAQMTNALRASRTTAADSNAVASLPASDPISTNQWIFPRAEAKALGLSFSGLSANDLLNDGEIYFSSNVAYSFDPTNRAVSGKFDFIGVAEHEITEVMGRIYVLNTIGGFPGCIPFDMFRFSAAGTRNFDPNAANIYFSINNGVTALKSFNSNPSGDIQDWATSTPPDSYDAFISTGQSGRLSSADLTTLDIIGYNLNFAAPKLTGATLTNGNFKISFTNVTGMGFVVLATTNLFLATANWTNLGTPVESPVGQYQFTDTQATANQARFYRVSLP